MCTFDEAMCARYMHISAVFAMFMCNRKHLKGTIREQFYRVQATPAIKKRQQKKPSKMGHHTSLVLIACYSQYLNRLAQLHSGSTYLNLVGASVSYKLPYCVYVHSNALLVALQE